MPASSGDVRVLSQALMEMEVEQHVGAARHKRTPERSGYRNGYRPRDCDTRIGTVELEVPRVRDGSYFPSLLEPGGVLSRPWRRCRRRGRVAEQR